MPPSASAVSRLGAATALLLNRSAHPLAGTLHCSIQPRLADIGARVHGEDHHRERHDLPARLGHAQFARDRPHPPAFAAIAGGTCAGFGILALIRHHTGVGGVNIIAMWLQKSRGWNVGRLHMVLDVAILLAALTSLTLVQFGWSLLSVVAINMILIAWHKPGRYHGH
jgi:uncharacterized membrane-anchored protein YitT (DUF2179 family)